MAGRSSGQLRCGAVLIRMHTRFYTQLCADSSPAHAVWQLSFIQSVLCNPPPLGQCIGLRQSRQASGSLHPPSTAALSSSRLDESPLIHPSTLIPINYHSFQPPRAQQPMGAQAKTPPDTQVSREGAHPSTLTKHVWQISEWFDMA